MTTPALVIWAKETKIWDTQWFPTEECSTAESMSSPISVPYGLACCYPRDHAKMEGLWWRHLPSMAHDTYRLLSKEILKTKSTLMEVRLLNHKHICIASVLCTCEQYRIVLAASNTALGHSQVRKLLGSTPRVNLLHHWRLNDIEP